MDNVVLYENKYFGFRLIKHVESNNSNTFSLVNENTPLVSQWRERSFDEILKLLTKELTEQEENVKQLKQLINNVKTAIE